MEGRDAAFLGVAVGLVDAYNRRDLDAWAAMWHADAHYHPTLLTGTVSLYVGRDSVRQFLEDVRDSGRGQTARVNDVRAVSDDQFVVRAEVMIDDQVVTPLTSIMRVKDGLIIEGRSYLAEAVTLERMGMIPEPD
jgi:ketosteroid isomerase-like protein